MRQRNEIRTDNNAKRSGDVELDELLARRDEVADKIANIVDRETKDLGVDITSVNLQTVELPEDMKRIIARQAEAEREKRAVIIKSEEN